MGSSPSLLKAAFCHPDLLAVLELQENHLGDFASRDVPSWHITPLLKIAAPDRPASHSVRKPVVSPNSVMTDSVAYDVPLYQRDVPLYQRHVAQIDSKRPRDPDWSRNSPVANELVDILNGALKDMGGWPICETIRCWCCSVSGPVRTTPPQMVEAFEKVCQQVNEAKLFSMGLQCRAGMYKIVRYCGQLGNVPLDVFCVLVEKRDDEKLRNVEAMDTLEYKNMLNGPLKKFYVPGGRDFRDHHALVTGWSPPANWIARCYDFPTPSNETTNYV
tara:strand:- start:77 stop:898 length:822 start_codon:yes stop_codon:yes gene_type:complete